MLEAGDGEQGSGSLTDRSPFRYKTKRSMHKEFIFAIDFVSLKDTDVCVVCEVLQADGCSGVVAQKIESFDACRSFIKQQSTQQSRSLQRPGYILAFFLYMLLMWAILRRTGCLQRKHLLVLGLLPLVIGVFLVGIAT